MACRCAAACSCGLICKSVLQPACFLTVSTLTTTPLLSRELSAVAAGAAMTTNGIDSIHARRAVMALADIRCEVSGHGSQLLAPRPPVVASATAQIEVAVVAAGV